MTEQPKYNIEEELSAIKSNVMTKWREIEVHNGLSSDINCIKLTLFSKIVFRKSVNFSNVPAKKFHLAPLKTSVVIDRACLEKINKI